MAEYQISVDDWNDVQYGWYNGSPFFGNYGHDSIGKRGLNQYEGLGVGLRFLNILLEPTDTVDNAKLYIYPQTPIGTAANTYSRLRGEQNVTPAIFSTAADYLARTRTTAQVDWDNMPAMVAGVWYESLDISPVIQEIIQLPGWASGNNLVIFWDDHDKRSVSVADYRWGTSYTSTPSQAPKLVIGSTPAVVGGGGSPAASLFVRGEI